MPSVCFYFQVHQPFRVKRYRIFDIGQDHEYFNDCGNGNLNNRRIIEKVARKCYLPTNALIFDLLREHPEFKVSFSLSGVVLDQFEQCAPEVIASFQKLISTGRVELLSETYYHSLAFLYSRDEFEEQVSAHRLKVKKLFAFTPRVFRNTELIYNNDLAKMAEEMGYVGILAEGADHILGWRSPNFIYQPAGTSKIKLLLKNYRLSDAIAFRFSERSGMDFPLTADKFAQWISSHNGSGELINLFMDYETFGEHEWEDTGIFNFLRALPGKILKHPDNDFVTPSEAIARYDARDVIDIPNFVSWADVERDLSAWLSNSIQHDAAHTLYSLRSQVLDTKDAVLIENWRRPQTSDPFYYMCKKWFADGDVHKYFNPYESPYDAFISFMNALHDVQLRIGLKNRERGL